MIPSTPEDQAAIKRAQVAREAEARSQLVRKARAYAHVFGYEGERTEDQLIVMKDLANLSAHSQIVIHRSDSGAVDPNAQLLDIGKRQIFTHIIGRIEQAKNPVPESP